MPLVGLSARPAQRNKVKEAVLTSIRSGYRHIDCSQAFENEDEVGEALDIIFSEGIVKREELWITSKLVGTNFGRERVLSSVIGSLDNLKVKQLDLLCMVFPYTGIVGPQVIPSIKVGILFGFKTELLNRKHGKQWKNLSRMDTFDVLDFAISRFLRCNKSSPMRRLNQLSVK